MQGWGRVGGPVGAQLCCLQNKEGSGVFAADEASHVFTLTPALSLRGRGRCFAAGSCIRTLRWFETRPTWLPLPAGEGWGEGERPRTPNRVKST